MSDLSCVLEVEVVVTTAIKNAIKSKNLKTEAVTVLVPLVLNSLNSEDSVVSSQ